MDEINKIQTAFVISVETTNLQQYVAMPEPTQTNG